MRRTTLFLLLAGLTGALAPAASAGTTCAELAGVPGTGRAPFCTVSCAMQYDPSVDPARTPAVDPGRPACMDQDA
jgi:hypothetical protein